MRAFGFGSRASARRRRGVPPVPMLAALALDAATLGEGSAAGIDVGGVVGRTPGATLALADSAGGRFALAGGRIVAGAVATDFEQAAEHAITLRETLTEVANSPRDSVVRIAVTNLAEAPALASLALSATVLAAGTPDFGDITGATTGSTITAADLPAGLTVDGAARRWAWDGAGSSGTAEVALTESLADSPNSPRDTVQTVTITAAAAGDPVIVAILAGQSNMDGRQAMEAVDSDPPHVWSIPGAGAPGGAGTLSADITPLYNDEAGYPADRLGPGQYVGRQLREDHPSADVVLLNCAVGSTRLSSGDRSWRSAAAPGAGGALFEAMVARANAALAPDGPVATTFPGRPVSVHFYWVQGEFDAGLVSTATYLADLADFITRARARVTGAAAAPFVIGSMLPQTWRADSPNLEPTKVAITRAHGQAVADLAGVRFAAGPYDYFRRDQNDNLHYGPADVLREQGRSLARILRGIAPPVVAKLPPAPFAVHAGQKLALPLDTARWSHVVLSGADADRFEFASYWPRHVIRWAGDAVRDATAPADANGDNVYDLTLTVVDGTGGRTVIPYPVTVVPAYGAPGAVTARFAASYFGAPVDEEGRSYLPAIQLGAGLNVIAVKHHAGPGRIAELRAAGAVATRLAGPDDTHHAFLLPVATAARYDLMIASASGPVSTLGLNALTVTGTAPAPAASAFLPAAMRAPPHAAPALALPGAGGIVVGLTYLDGGFTVPVAGVTTLPGSTGKFWAGSRTDAGPVGIAGSADPDYSHALALAFAKA